MIIVAVQSTAESKLISPSCSQTIEIPWKGSVSSALNQVTSSETSCFIQQWMLEIFSICQSTHEADCRITAVSHSSLCFSTLAEYLMVTSRTAVHGFCHFIQCMRWGSLWHCSEHSNLCSRCCSASPPVQSHLLLTGEEAAACILKIEPCSFLRV